ncbi:MAG: sugar ABC transporter permease [Paenibacillaceae bacterium]|nr:sugar ABC transporter permease [Paenibacillaceae bacterium]
MKAGRLQAAGKEGSFAYKWRRIRGAPFLYGMAVPGVALLFLFSYLPMYGILIAFKHYSLTAGVWRSPWAGFDNFAFFLTSDQLYRVIRNTLLLNVAFLFFTTVFAVAAAVLLNEMRTKWLKRVSQSVMFLPFFMSWVVVGMIVESLLGGQQPMVNEWLVRLGLPEVSWFTEPGLWPWIFTVLKVWHGAGYYSIIYLAAIAAIPEDLYEAARIDGASRLAAMRRITLPLLMPTVSILTLLAIGKIFNGDFAMIYAIVGDNSLLFPSTDVIDTYVFRAMRQLNDFGMSSAVGLFQSVMGFVFVLGVNAIVKRVSRDSALF